MHEMGSEIFSFPFFMGRWCQQIIPAILHQSAGTLLKITHSSLLWILTGRTDASWVKFSRPALSIRLSFKLQLKLEAFSVARSGASCTESRDGWKTFHWVHTTSFTPFITASVVQCGQVQPCAFAFRFTKTRIICKSVDICMINWLICLFSIDAWTLGSQAPCRQFQNANFPKRFKTREWA